MAQSIFASYSASTGPALSVDVTGALTSKGSATFQNNTDSTTAFQVKNAGGGETLCSASTP